MVNKNDKTGGLRLGQGFHRCGSHTGFIWVGGIRTVAICGSLHGPFSSTSAVLYIILLLHPSPLHVVVCKRVQQYHSFGSPSLHIGILSIFP